MSLLLLCSVALCYQQKHSILLTGPPLLRRNKFWGTATFNAAGFLLTLFFLPDPLRISLAETDRRWRYITSGRTYHGEAINTKSLSLFERTVFRLQKVSVQLQ